MSKKIFPFIYLLLLCTGQAVAEEKTVSNATDLAAIAAQCADDGCAGKTYVLTEDIVLPNQSWTPIGTKGKPFKGTFRGDGHMIKGVLKFTETATEGVGLFGYVGEGAVVEQVGISGTVVAPMRHRVGAIAGVCSGTIRQCWSMAYIATAGNVVGGLVGELTEKGTITDAYHSGLIDNASDTIGGIAGKNSKGTMRRVYNTGYAKNGKAIVGFDNGGKYPNCYYDRKLYYQESGITDDKSTPVDVTEDMFKLYSGNAAWSQQINIRCYPILKVFEGKDAAILSTAPMYIDKDLKVPVNHANDLTVDFSLCVLNGSITWTCQNKRSEDWIQITGAFVHVVRPCTETDVLVDVQLGEDKRVVYMRPRRVEDLQPGKFLAHDGKKIHGHCFKEDVPVNGNIDYSSASEGWMEDPYHYMIVRYEILATDTVVKDTLLDDTNPDNYKAWFMTASIPTNEAGHYIIRSYVHDEGCVQDWLENKKGYEYTIFPEFDPGIIQSGEDTILLTKNPCKVTVPSLKDASGGGGEITYQWKNKGTALYGTNQDSLTYSIIRSGTYTFTRTAQDSAQCCGDNIIAEGEYTYYVFDSLNPGEILTPNELTFCTPEEANDYTIRANVASGGISDKGYSYQWYRVVGTDTTAITGATAQNLDLKNFTFAAEKTYIFVRKAWDNTRFTTWTLSRKSSKIYIMKELNPGAIHNGILANECVPYDAEGSTTITITVPEVSAAEGESTLEYKWVRRTSGGTEVEVGNTRELKNYSFQLWDISLDTEYEYVRYVRNSPECSWIQSGGIAKQYYGRKSYGEVTITVCEDELPYSMKWVDGNTYTFTYSGQKRTLSDMRGECPADTLFTVVTAKIPAFTMDTIARFCQETGTITLNFVVKDGTMNVYKVTYSDALAKLMKKSGATGTITVDNTVVLDSIPPLNNDPNYYIDLQLGYSDDVTSDAGVCYSTKHRMQLNPSLGGYLHSKYDRVLFVDNNPDNNLLPEAAEKLKFVGYQWYRNGVKLEGETGQYYHEGGSLLNGVYYVELIDESGKSYRSCDIEIHPSSSAAPLYSAVYPVPVGAGEPLTVEAMGTVRIRAFSGEYISPQTTVEGQQIITAPYAAGIYYVEITALDGSVEMHKLIVK